MQKNIDYFLQSTQTLQSIHTPINKGVFESIIKHKQATHSL